MQNVAAYHEDPSTAPDCDRAMIALAHAGSHIADLIGISAYPSMRGSQLPEIAIDLSEITG